MDHAYGEDYNLITPGRILKIITRARDPDGNPKHFYIVKILPGVKKEGARYPIQILETNNPRLKIDKSWTKKRWWWYIRKTKWRRLRPEEELEYKLLYAT